METDPTPEPQAVGGPPDFSASTDEWIAFADAQRTHIAALESQLADARQDNIALLARVVEAALPNTTLRQTLSDVRDVLKQNTDDDLKVAQIVYVIDEAARAAAES